MPFLAKMITYAVQYYQDFVKPKKQYQAPNQMEKEALQRLHDELEDISMESTAEDLQTIVFEVGKQFAFTDFVSGLERCMKSY
jgi:lysyl-tRNA synthetase class 1